MQADVKKEIDQALADFFFGCNIPFVNVESPYFVNFVNKLNGNYKLPTRKTLSGSLLNQRFDKLKNQIVNNPSTQGVLLLDGWKNTSANAKYEVAMLRLDDSQNILLNSWNFSTFRETADNLVEVVEECKDISQIIYNKEIYAVVTDNASNMMLTGMSVDLWNTTCNSHSGNLLCKSIVNDAPEFYENVHKLIKEFKNPRLEGLLLRRHGNRMVIPGDTRWCSVRDAYRRVLKNLTLMRRVINDDDGELREESRLFLFSEDIEAQLVDHLLILDPICRLIRTCEKNDINIADATELWFQLEFPVNNDRYRLILQERIRKALNVFGLSANLLHPVYQGAQFADNVANSTDVNDFLEHELSANGLRELNAYKEKTGMFANLFQNNYEWKVFWRTAAFFYPELSKIAIRLLNIPASTSELERLFSQWEYVHGKRRNRLTHERSMKLASIYYHLRAKNSLQYDDESDSDPD